MSQASGATDLGIVSKCEVINCIYNQGQQCTAGAINVTFEDEVAKCFTYTLSDTEDPVSSLPGGIRAGDVSQCDVIDCTYNEGQRCTAAEITVTFIESTAQCATYTLPTEHKK